MTDPSNPKKLWVGISAAGVFATEDGGTTWERRNRLSNAAACDHHDHPAAPRDGETGHCVHNMMLAPGSDDRLYQQNHHGVWRSADGGRSWAEAALSEPVLSKALEHGLVLLSCGYYGNTIRLLAPLTIPDAHLEEGLDILEQALGQSA